MVKHIYKGIILLCIFVASLYVFSKDIKEVVFSFDNTTTMEKASLPLVSIGLDELEVNLLHGYTSDISGNKIRGPLLPLDQDPSYNVLIEEFDYDIKKLKYEVRDFKGNQLIESETVSVFTMNGERKSAQIKIRHELEKDKSYSMKISLITSKGKKINYYHRIKALDDPKIDEKINFVMDFNKKIMSKDTANEMIIYLEPKADAKNTTLANVNIHSSFELISWADLKPKLESEVGAQILESHDDIMSVELSFIVKANINKEAEYYSVKEFYRIRYTGDRVYLLNYNRTMESIFNMDNEDIKDGEFRVGVTQKKDLDFITNASKSKVAFVWDRQLWSYDFETNESVDVFSFIQEDTDYIRDMYDQHDIKILDMDEEGNMSFMVYGYMNRGHYEGKVGIVLYNYRITENQIEELIYIPVDEPYQLLKEGMSDFSYLSPRNIFYFSLYNKVYSYDLITDELEEIGEVPLGGVVIESLDQRFFAWQGDGDSRGSKTIYIMDTISQEKMEILPPKGHRIRLLGIVDNNLIYGFVKESDVMVSVDGRTIAPAREIVIASFENEVLKTYKDGSYYISNVEVRENIIEIKRLVKQGGKYKDADSDYIMNQVSDIESIVKINKEISKKELETTYLSFNKAFSADSEIKTSKAVGTVVTKDTTLRLPVAAENNRRYYPSIYGNIEGSYDMIHEAIKIADENVGVVLNQNQETVWERGVRSSSISLKEVEAMDLNEVNKTDIESAIIALLKHQGVNARDIDLEGKDVSIYDIMEVNSQYTPIIATGISLDEVLYYVSKGAPVISIKNGGKAFLIYGYDSFNIYMKEIRTNTLIKKGIKDSAKDFEEDGNIFITYIK